MWKLQKSLRARGEARHKLAQEYWSIFRSRRIDLWEGYELQRDIRRRLRADGTLKR